MIPSESKIIVRIKILIKLPGPLEFGTYTNMIVVHNILSKFAFLFKIQLLLAFANYSFIRGPKFKL